MVLNESDLNFTIVSKDIEGLKFNPNINYKYSHFRAKIQSLDISILSQ